MDSARSKLSFFSIFTVAPATLLGRVGVSYLGLYKEKGKKDMA
jgi:hypothetical protein